LDFLALETANSSLDGVRRLDADRRRRALRAWTAKGPFAQTMVEAASVALGSCVAAKRRGRRVAGAGTTRDTGSKKPADIEGVDRIARIAHVGAHPNLSRVANSVAIGAPMPVIAAIPALAAVPRFRGCRSASVCNDHTTDDAFSHCSAPLTAKASQASQRRPSACSEGEERTQRRKHMRSRLVLAAGPLALVACATAPVPQPAAPVLSHTEVLTKLDSPWDMAFLPNGTMFFIEKCLGLSVRQPNGTVVKLLGMKDSTGYASTAGDLFCEGQAGMNGVAVDPNFASNRFICVYSTSSLTAPGTNRVLISGNSNDDEASPYRLSHGSVAVERRRIRRRRVVQDQELFRLPQDRQESPGPPFQDHRRKVRR
jgi:hypothetical protein